MKSDLPRNHKTESGEDQMSSELGSVLSAVAELSARVDASTSTLSARVDSLISSLPTMFERQAENLIKQREQAIQMHKQICSNEIQKFIRDQVDRIYDELIDGKLNKPTVKATKQIAGFSVPTSISLSWKQTIIAVVIMAAIAGIPWAQAIIQSVLKGSGVLP